ncbi:MAG: CAP domain-containing protein [Patescibacteria group bacterium]|nr:CAP domain-containing protein [Patescibacteria group bacterium]
MKRKFKDIFQIKKLNRVVYSLLLGIFSMVVFVGLTGQARAANNLINSEVELVRLTNHVRAEAGLNSLSVNYTLQRSAEAKAYDMAVNGYFAHEDKLGRRVSYWLKNSGYDYLRAGENLARGFDDPIKLVEAWKRSETHYANMVNKNYAEIGIGIAEGVIYGKPAVFIVQHFGEPYPLPTIAFIEPISAAVLGDVTYSDLSEPLLRDLPNSNAPEVGPAYQAASATVTNNSLIGSFLVASSEAADGISAGLVNTGQADLTKDDVREYILYSESAGALAGAVFLVLIGLAFWLQGKVWSETVRLWSSRDKN